MLKMEFEKIFQKHPDIIENIVEDLKAVKERDPACESFIEPLLFYKGFRAVQIYRITHALWKDGRRAFAREIYNHVCKLLQVDIHPGAEIGPGILMDHATGIVIGETTKIKGDTSLLHRVTLGGSGKEPNDQRHPIIDEGVLIGAGAIVQGPVKIGKGVKIGAGTLVVTDIPDGHVAVGVPARVILPKQKEGKQQPEGKIPAYCMD